MWRELTGEKSSLDALVPWAECGRRVIPELGRREGKFRTQVGKARAVERERGVLERGRRARAANAWNTGTDRNKDHFS